MQIFLLGKTKTGKTTLARQIENIVTSQKKAIHLYEAGSWARKEFKESNPHLKEDEMSNIFKNQLTDFALNKLKQNSLYSVEKYQEWKSHYHPNCSLIIGVRNPEDFILMLQKDKENKIIWIESEKQFEGSLEQFEKGLDIVFDYVKWKQEMGMPLAMLSVKENKINTSSLTEEITQFLKDIK